MAFFSRLFKKKQQPETLEQKIAALANKNGQERMEIAQNAKEDALRVAVIAKLPFSQGLVNLALSDNAAVATAARKRIGQLLDEGATTLEALSRAIPSSASLVDICAYSSQTGTSLIEQINDEAQLIAIAQNASTTQTRQAAAERISSRDSLESLARLSRNKDKAVYKIVKSKLDVFRQAEQEAAQRSEEIRSICAQLEQLAKREPDEIFRVRRKQIDAAWRAVAGHAAELEVKRYEIAAGRCDARLAEIEARQQSQAEQHSHQHQAGQQLEQSLNSLRSVLEELYTSDTPPELAQRLPQLIEDHHQALEQTREQGLPVEQATRRGQALIKEAQGLAKELAPYGSFASLRQTFQQAEPVAQAELFAVLERATAHARLLDQTRLPAGVAEAREQLQQWRDRQQAQQQEEKSRFRKLNDLLRRGRWAVDAGQVGRARGILRDVRDIAEKIGQLPPSIEERVTDLQAAIDKLGDWHQFAVTPKKEALIEQMERLIDSSLALPDRAEQIHQLQQSWRELSRGGQNQDEALWQRFQQASRQAYEPCEAYFAEQARAREQNAENRRTLLQQLREYLTRYDWDNANWSEVEKTLKVSRQAWLSYWPVPRKLVKELQAEFDELLDALYAKLNTEFERNRLKKQQLVERAASLAESADSRTAIDQAKQLQQQWQTLGRSKRKDDQMLWQAFRTHCDTIFAKRQQETEQLRVERQSAKQEAEALIGQLERLSQLQGQALLAARDEIDGVVQAFKGIGELPREDSKTIASRFDRLSDQLEQNVAAAKAAQHKQRWLDVLNAADVIRQYELALAAGRAGPDFEKKATEVLENASLWPAGAYSQLELRLQSATQPNQQTQADCAESLRRLCIRSEVVNEVGSPESDRQLRMAYQVELLQQGLGQAELPDESTLADVILEWIAVPGVADPTYQDLLARLDKAWELGIKDQPQKTGVLPA